MVTACTRGYVEIARALLEDTRSTPAIARGKLVRSAKKFGHVSIVELLGTESPVGSPKQASSKAPYSFVSSPLLREQAEIVLKESRR